MLGEIEEAPKQAVVLADCGFVETVESDLSVGEVEAMCVRQRVTRSDDCLQTDRFVVVDDETGARGNERVLWWKDHRAQRESCDVVRQEAEEDRTGREIVGDREHGVLREVRGSRDRRR